MASGLEIRSQGKVNVFGVILGTLALVIVILVGWWLFNWYINGVKPPVPLPSVVTADPSVDETPVPKEKVDSYTVPANNPRYISIPTLDIEKVRVMNLGLINGKQLDAPKNINDVGWYNSSAMPGDGVGAVLIDGHNGGITRDGVFAKLYTLKVGDEIMIERGDGEKLTYRVAENESMTLDEANKTGMKKLQYSAEPDKEGLSLITCDGNWVPKDQVFDRRIMLRAVRVS